MGSRPRSFITSMPMPMRRTRRRRACKLHKSSRIIAANGSCTSNSVSDKLEALKNLIPAQIDGDIKADELFQETADYIVLLRTQILVLQKLVNLYGSDTALPPPPPPRQDNENAV